jgi:hypothetical protein
MIGVLARRHELDWCETAGEIRRPTRHIARVRQGLRLVKM